jgi:asparagine N-glycosylation enzyme membrane subunit Stt3
MERLSKENEIMLWTIFVILLVLWLLGLVTAYTFGGFVHPAGACVGGAGFPAGYRTQGRLTAEVLDSRVSALADSR